MSGKNEYGELQVVNIRLVKEPSIISDEPITTAADASGLIKKLIQEFDREAFCVLNVANDGSPISMNIASVGTLNAALVSPREVFKSSILSNAAGFLCFHCHPSGNPKPSRDDAITTQRLRDAGEVLDIKMLDHIIVGCGSGRTYSFAAEDMLHGDIVGKFDDMKRNREFER